MSNVVLKLRLKINRQLGNQCAERNSTAVNQQVEDSDLNYYIIYALCYCINLGFIYFIMQWLRAVCWEGLNKHDTVNALISAQLQISAPLKTQNL